MLKNARLVFLGIPYTRENGPIPVAFYNLFWFDTWACMTCISIAPLSKMAPISGFAQRSNLDEGQETVPQGYVVFGIKTAPNRSLLETDCLEYYQLGLNVK